MTREEMHDVAEQAADRAVKRMLLTLGVDINSPEAIIRFQRNVAFMDALRASSDAVKRKAILTAVTVLVTGMLGYLWLAFRSH